MTAADAGRERVSEAARAERRTDRMAAQAMEDAAQTGGAGVCRGCKFVLSDFWRMRVRLGGDRESGGDGGGRQRNGRQRKAYDLVSAAERDDSTLWEWIRRAEGRMGTMRARR